MSTYRSYSTVPTFSFSNFRSFRCPRADVLRENFAEGLEGPKENNWRSIWLGSYDWSYLCMPHWPYCRAVPRKGPDFYGSNQWLGILLAAAMGLQHAFAVVIGLITPPLILSTMAEDEATKRYLVSAALIVCGLMTCVQCLGIKLPFNMQWGAGVLSVVGVSFSSLPLAQSTVSTLMSQGHSFHEAYGKLLGSVALCGLTPLAISFLPHKLLKKIFPPSVCGATIILIGMDLVGTGIKYWGGGVFCANNYLGIGPDIRPQRYEACQRINPSAPPLTPLNTTAPCYVLPQPAYTPCTYTDPHSGAIHVTTCFSESFIPLCSTNGDVMLPFGSAPYLGLGLVVFGMLIICEIFGSPFMRSASCIFSLGVGYCVAAMSRVDGKRFVNGKTVQEAQVVSFLWTTTFPLRIYPPVILPLIIVFIITSLETVGDVTATEEASHLPTQGPQHQRHVTGALVNDSISGIFSALSGSLPLTTFAQNNGVISITNVASRYGGLAAGLWLLIFGLNQKIGAAMASVPDCVLGGLTTFLFANVTVSGMKILLTEKITRRTRFVLVCSIGIGLGVTVCPQFVTNNLWKEVPGMSAGMHFLRETFLIICQNGFTVGTVVALVLNLGLPQEIEQVPGQNADQIDAFRHTWSMKTLAELAVAEGLAAAPLLAGLSDEEWERDRL